MKTEEPPARRDINERVLKFAQRVLRMRDALIRDRRVDRNALQQVVKSSSGIGSNLEEANAAQSRADFDSKLRIALKEARESHYWLRYLEGSGPVRPARIQPLIDEANPIDAMLTTISKKSDPNKPRDPNAGNS